MFFLFEWVCFVLCVDVDVDVDVCVRVCICYITPTTYAYVREIRIDN